MTNEFSTLITDNCAYLKACVLYLLYFTKRKHFKNCKKTLCILSKKVFTFSIYSIFCNFFSFLSTVSRFKESDETRRIMTS